jgi:hypothetical protein
MFCRCILILYNINAIQVVVTYTEFYIQGDQNVSVKLIITIEKVTSSVQSVSRQSPDIY